MTGGLRDFLVRLATDPECLAQFTADPTAALETAGLSPEERAVVLSRDSDRIREALGGSAADHLTQDLDTAKKRLGRKRPPKKRPGAKKRPSKKASARAKKR